MVRIPSNCNEQCPPELQVIDSVSGKWTAIIIQLLGTKPFRNGALRRAVPGISQKVLTQTLRRLERDGVIGRKVYPVVPPQVEYFLTPLGGSLVLLLSDLCVWARKHYEEIEKARAQFDGRAQSDIKNDS